MKIFYTKIKQSFVSALPKASKTTWWLLKIILPVSLAVSLMQFFGIINWMATYLTPVFSQIGLPGEAAIVFISSVFLPLYAPIAIVTTLAMDMREITILALMCLISHNMIVESAIQKKTGSSFFIMFSIRLLFSFISAFLLNYFLPEDLGKALVSEKASAQTDLTTHLLHWIKSAGWLVVKMALIISGLMILQNILREFKILQALTKVFAPVMKFFGLSDDSSFLWLVGQILGLTYGSAVMLEQVHNNDISKKDADYLNYHIAINHSQLEDTMLFIAIGVPGFWIIFPRFVLAVILVWAVRFIQKDRIILKS